MNDDKIIEILEGQEIDEDKIVSIIDQLKENKKTEVLNDFATENWWFMEKNEKDPLKRAAAVARMISKSFDE